MAQPADRALLEAMYREHLLVLVQWNPGVDVEQRQQGDWFERPGRLFPWLILEPGGEVAGFALVVDRSYAEAMGIEDADFVIYEFFVRAASRRTGIGRRAIRALRARHAGRWCVTVLQDNVVALRFWRGVLGADVHWEEHEADGVCFLRVRDTA